MSFIIYRHKQYGHVPGNRPLWDSEDYDRIEPYEFYGPLYLHDCRRTNHTISYTWMDEKGSEYNMMFSDMFDLLKRSAVSLGRVDGKFGFKKRGDTTGIYLIEAL